MSEYFPGLRSRADDVRLKAARDLQRYVSTELRELEAEDYNTELDVINQNIFGLMSSPELHEKKGGVLAIGKSAESAQAHLFFTPLSPGFYNPNPHPICFTWHGSLDQCIVNLRQPSSFPCPGADVEPLSFWFKSTP